jgi:PAS domain S-box-containing protein
MSTAAILIVDGDEGDAAHVKECLDRLGHSVCGVVGCGRQAMEVAADARPDLALVDLCLSGEVGGAEVGELLGRRFDVPVVYLTGGAGGELLQRAAASNPFGYVLPPFDARQLDLVVATAIARHAREREQRATESGLRQEIAALREAEAAAQQTILQQHAQAQLMATIFSSISDGVVVADSAGKFSLFNPSAEQIVGVGMLDLPPEEWTERYGVFYPDRKSHVPTAQLPLVRAIQGDPTDEIELFIRNEQRQDGVYISVNGRPLPPDVDGGGGGVIVFRDITRQKQAEAELALTMAKLRDRNELIDTAFKSINDGIVVANAEGEFLYVNPAAEQIVGLGITDGPQDEWSERYGTYYPDRETTMATEDLPLIRAIHRGESVDEEDLFIRNRNRPNGVYIRVSARPLLNKIGGIRGGVIVFRDVTERVIAEEALARAFAEGRLEVVETILHNIGNAITSVTTGIETVRRSLVNDRVGRRLAALADALAEHRDDWIDYLRNDPQGRKVLPFIIELAEGFATRKSRLIKTVGRVRDRANRIADIVRTQKALGTATMDRKDVDLHDTLASAVRVLRESLSKRGIRTGIDCEGAPHEIRIRESQFHQMLVNLIKNAIEAIDDLAAAHGLDRQPHVRITARTEGKFLVVDVSDNGIGIGTRDTKVLFAPGYTTKPSGSGLGLHSAANFVIASGGRIEPLSQGPGKGTTMRVMLPLSSVVPPAQEA